ncbi:MAG: N-acetyl-gamma-glutamyl-phosphate reductase [Pseudomonadales bacterium]|nr:N-acetyl-gamma-glutamyl-phosphate reductase [Pseudomonadales bacterium]
MFKVGIVGGTGYTGVELLRLLALHPDIKVKAITSRSEQGVSVSSMFSNLRGFIDLEFTEPTLDQLRGCDLVFFATPNGVAMHMAPDLLNAGIKVVDLSADFRLQDAQSWATWYGQTHACPEFLPEAVYGLPEVNAELIAQARLVANPGCYPTSVQLALLPLLSAGVIALEGVIADCKSGVSGAGRQAHISSLLPEAGDSFKAYGVPGHRHLPEINQQLSVYAEKPIELTFVPHLLPMIRGIHATVYTRLVQTDIDVQALFESFYQQHELVDVMPAGSHPETRSVRGSNICRLAVHRPQSGKTLVILSVIDNLVKGAAGQAVQNMNLMLGLPQNRGLQHVPLMP